MRKGGSIKIPNQSERKRESVELVFSKNLPLQSPFFSLFSSRKRESVNELARTSLARLSLLLPVFDPPEVGSELFPCHASGRGAGLSLPRGERERKRIATGGI